MNPVSAEVDEPGPIDPQPSMWDERRVPLWFPRAVFYVVLAFIGYAIARELFNKLSDLIVIVVVAFFVSFAVEPAVDWLADRGWRRGAATGVVFLVTAIVGGILVFVVIDLVVQQVSTLIDDAPGHISRVTRWVNKRFDTHITTDSIIDQIKQYRGDVANTASDVGGRVLSVTGSVLGIVFHGLTVALFAFYLVADGPKLRRNICSLLPANRQHLVLGLWEIAIRKTGGYLYSRILLATVTAVSGTIAFSIIGLPSPLALAVWAGIVAQFVPVIGTYIGGALPFVIALLNDPPKSLWVLGYLIVFQQIEIYVLAPRISSKTMAIHPAVAFGSALAGAGILGPIGALLALPAAAIIQAFVSSYVNRHELVDNALIAAKAVIAQTESPALVTGSDSDPPVED